MIFFYIFSFQLLFNNALTILLRARVKLLRAASSYAKRMIVPERRLPSQTARQHPASITHQTDIKQQQQQQQLNAVQTLQTTMIRRVKLFRLRLGFSLATD